MRLFGTVAFEIAGASYRFTSSPGGPIELRTDGVVFPAASFVDFVPWTDVRDLRGWSPPAKEPR